MSTAENRPKAPTIFLSYSRDDDTVPEFPNPSFIERLYSDLTKAGLDVWLDQVTMPARDLTFHQEIKDAINARDRLLLVIGPRSAIADYVIKEWRHALEAEKVITSILFSKDPSFQSMPAKDAFEKYLPRQIRMFHCEDFRDLRRYESRVGRLIKKLSDPLPPIGMLVEIPPLPSSFLARPEKLRTLRFAVRIGLDSVVAPERAVSRVGLHGMGGIGKSVLATAVARDRKVRQAFPDGIFWIRVGETLRRGFGTADEPAGDPSARLVMLQRRLASKLGGSGVISDIPDGIEKLRLLLGQKSVLLILDDVWSAEQVRAFEVLGPRSNALITTRDRAVVRSLQIQELEMELLSHKEARELLSRGTAIDESKLPAEADHIIKEAGRLPLAISLCAGMIRCNKPWRSLIEAFKRRELSSIKQISPGQELNPEHENLWRTINLSVADLKERARERFVELAVFETDDPIPEVAIATLWQHSGKMSRNACEDLLLQLVARHLLDGSGLGQENPNFQMHDLIYAFVRRSAEGEDRPPEEEVVRVDLRTIKHLHVLMLDAYKQRSTNGWPCVPNDGYFFSHLRDHLSGAGRTSELADLVMSPAWLEAKHRHKLIGDALIDLRSAHQNLPDADGRRGTLKTLELALRRDIDFIVRYHDTYPQGLFQCLWNRLRFGSQTHSVPTSSPAADDASAQLVKAWRNDRRKQHQAEVLLSLNQPLPDLLETNLIRVFRSAPDAAPLVRGSPVGSGELLDISADGNLLACYVSGAANHVHIWTMETGAVAGSLALGELRLSSLRFEPSATAVIGVCHDGTIRTWDWNMQQEIATITIPMPESNTHLTCSSISADGRLVAHGSADGSVQVWDRGTRARLWERPLTQAEVTALAFDLPSERLFVGDHTGSVTVADRALGDKVAAWKDRGSRITSIASDGIRVFIGSDDGHVVEWNMKQVSSRTLFSNDDDSIASLVIDCDATRLGWALRASKFRGYAIDRTVYVKDLTSDDAEVSRLAGNPDDVYHLAIRKPFVASTGADWQPCLWDFTSSITSSRGEMIYANDVQDAGSGRVIAAGDDGTARIYQRDGLAEVSSCRHGGPVWSVVALAQTQRPSGLFGALAPRFSAISKAIRRLSDPRAARSVPFSETIVAVTAGEGDRLKIWDVMRHEEVIGIPSSDRGTFACRATRDRAHLLFGDSTLSPDQSSVDWSRFPQDLTLWSAETGAQTGSFHVESGMEYRREIVVTPDNHLLITALDHLRLGVWSLWSGELLWALRVPAQAQILAVAVDPRGRLIAAGDIAGYIYILDLSDHQTHILPAAHNGYLRGLAFTDDGRYLISASDDQTMKVWSVPDYTLKACVELGQWITCLTTSFRLDELILGLNDGNLRSVRLEGSWDWGPPIVTAGRRFRVKGYAEENGRRKLIGEWSRRPSAACPFCGREVIATGAVLKAAKEWESTFRSGESPCMALSDDAWNDERLHQRCRGCKKNLRWNPFLMRQP